MNRAAHVIPPLATLEQLGPHEHLCSIYESPQEHFAVAVPFIRIGLNRGEQCIYIVDDGTEDTVREAMSVEGIDVERVVASRALVFATKEQTYLRQRPFDPEWMSAFWKDATKLAMSEGFSALRVTGDTEWILSGPPGLERWMEYESRLTQALSESHCLVLCQYDRRCVSPELILDVIRTHPTVIYRGTVCRNVYHVPSVEFLGVRQCAREAERLLTTIHERELAEKAIWEMGTDLADSERLFRLFVGSVVDYAIFMLDPHGRVTSWNSGAERLKGYREDEILGHHFSRFYVREDIERGKPQHELELASAADRFEDEGWRVRKDGSTFWANAVITAMRDPAGKLLGFGKITRDLTERRLATERTGDSEARLQAFMDNSPSFMFVKDLQGRYVYVNENFTRHFGFERRDIISCTDSEIFSAEMAAQFQADDARALAVGAGLQVEEVARYVDGLSHTSIVQKFPILDSRGQVIALGGIGTDITERKRAEEALRAAQTELTRASLVITMGELTASIAHEVNQPLAAVITGSHACLRWLAGTTPNLDEARQVLDRIIRAGNSASDVIARIRALVGKTGTEKGPLDVNAVIQEVVAVTQGEVMRNGIALGTELADRLPPVVGDRVQLQQVMLNLIMNGIEAMNARADGPKELLITTQQRQGHVRVAVRDSGVGLDQQSLERLFEAFYTTKPQGLGIGLSISRSIIVAHGGRLWAVRNDGPGATFQFTLPVYDSAAPLRS